MGDVMEWSNFTDEATSAIQRAVLLQRRTGLKNEHAIETVADLFQLSPRRVRAWLYGEVFAVAGMEGMNNVKQANS